ncbi:MAG: hypothetical protein CL760_10440 [Chloroflexi bacterium]|nr:hypothetical protein [Chloroflexota bacterium]|tara:strand:+ start:23754 stop:24806 length:1053 start_codon:yes stop_codon:yes gene_type:complete
MDYVSMIKESVGMFLFLGAELTVLFLAISYIVGILQEYIPPEKIQSILGGKNGKGYVIAAFLGSITPFCSCSTIPFLKGLLRAKAGFGPMMVFLFASPLLNPIIIGLFAITFGWKVTIFYFLIALLVSIISGYILEKLGFERFVKKEAYSSANNKVSCCETGCETKVEGNSSCCETNCGTGCESKVEEKCSCCETKVEKNSCCDSTSSMVKKETVGKWRRIWDTTWKDFKQVLPYLIFGILLGSLIYGFIPSEYIASVANENNPFAVPIAAIIGVPLYIRAEAVIPLTGVLMEKGMGAGAIMSLIIGSAGASLTEVILLKSIFKNQMIAAFLFVIFSMAISAGYLYYFIF